MFIIGLVSGLVIGANIGLICFSLLSINRRK